LTEAFFDNVSTLMLQSGPWEFLPERCKTHLEMYLAFGMLARASGGIFGGLASSFAAYPYRLWLLVDPLMPVDEAARLLYKDRPCMFDTFTQHIRKLYPTESDLKKSDLRSLLLSIGLLVRLDTSRIECRHAWVRRLLGIKGQTWKYLFGDASADYFLSRTRASERCAHQDEPEQQANVPEKRSRGGGRCRSFLSKFIAEHHTEHDTTSDVFRAAHAAYKAMLARGDDSEMELHATRGRAGTIAHRAGGLSFEGRARKRPRLSVASDASIVDGHLSSTDLVVADDGQLHRNLEVAIVVGWTQHLRAQVAETALLTAVWLCLSAVNRWPGLCPQNVSSKVT
jgi:hypothetical protein